MEWGGHGLKRRLLLGAILAALSGGCATQSASQEGGNAADLSHLTDSSAVGPSEPTAKDERGNASERAAPEEEEEEEEPFTDHARPSDPLKPFNRAMYTFNDRLYFYVLKPVAQGYTKISPRPVREGIGHFFTNLRAPGRLVNSLLQGKLQRSGQVTAEFFINSTLGVLGFMTPAQDAFGLEPPREDTGQTLAVWGVPSGPYVVWPILGPSNFRDTIGNLGDSFLDPVHYVDPFWAALGIRSFERVNGTALRLGDYEAIKASALDPYTAIKDGFRQQRTRQIQE